MTTKDPRQIRSIKKLQEAYLSLLLNNKPQITILQLCEEANVTRPTFYNNYTDMLDLRKQIHENILDDLSQSLTITNTKPIDAFEEGELPENMVGLFKHILENKQAYEVLLIDQPDGLFIEHMKRVLRKFIVDGMKYASSEKNVLQVKVPFADSFATGAYYESIIWWIENRYSFSPEEMARQLLKISLHGPFEREG